MSSVVKPSEMYPADIIAAAQATGRPRVPKAPFPSVTLAQWRLESNAGKSLSGKNNFFGITATHDQIEHGEATIVWTQEFVSGYERGTPGKYVKMQRFFADYATVEDCFAEHTKLLLSLHYKVCQDAKTPSDYCVALQKCGYATAPNYGQVLQSIMGEDKLSQYDM